MKVSNSAGKSIVVRITDECPSCTAAGQLDLSEKAFSQLADLSAGIIPISYEYVPCSLKGNIKYHVKNGANLYWMAVFVDNHKVGVKKLEIKGSNTDWITMQRQTYNAFVYQNGNGFGLPISFRVTSIDGEVITDENICSLFYRINCYIWNNKHMFF